MSIIHNSLLSSKLFHLPHTESTRNSTSLVSFKLSPIKKRDFLSPAVASVPCPPIDVDYLQKEFSGHGVSFSEISDSCVVRMALENGSVANLLLPSGLITSYKAQMWHGGIMELLHTTVSEGEDGSPVVQGGISLDLKFENDEGISWSPKSWILHEVKGSPQGMTQVELISRNAEVLLELRHIITLQEDLISSEIIISNSNASPVNLMGSILSHLVVSTPEATYAMGLEGSDFFSRSPVQTGFSIVPPSFGERNYQESTKSWGPLALISKWDLRNRKTSGRLTEEALEGEEEDSYKHLTEEMSKIYTSAPSNFTIIDRGRRNSVVIGGDGFKELYLFSPGSSHNSYSKYSYICVGHTALLQAIVLDPQSKWKGEQQLCNPNL